MGTILSVFVFLSTSFSINLNIIVFNQLPSIVVDAVGELVGKIDSVGTIVDSEVVAQ